MAALDRFDQHGIGRLVRAVAAESEPFGLQPRTPEGSFWHKAIYPNQVWLDGIYMAQPFYALHEKHFGKGDFSDTVSQIETVRARMFSKETGLYYHGYDASAPQEGRKVYLDRVEWDADGWPSVGEGKPSKSAEMPIIKGRGK